jgi:hypothetical protein
MHTKKKKREKSKTKKNLGNFWEIFSKILGQIKKLV